MSSSDKINIFCPIETINRELDFRLFFAAQCVRPGMRCIVGQRFVIYRLLSEMGGGMYLGQNVRPIQRPNLKDSLKGRLDTLRAVGSTLVVVDEEGGVMAGDESRWKEWLDFRVDVKSLQPQEHLCTWGNYQRDYYRTLDTPSPQQIVTTGHPRFDLYKPKFQSYYADEVEKWKSIYGDFVIINTNFAWGNHFKGDEYLFTDNSYFDGTNPHKRLDFVRQWAHTTQVRSNMVALVMKISIDFPNLNIIIRPHPSENMESYKFIFNNVPNVHVEHEGSVGPWLMASRALIHDGCTTALEAHFSGVPILNYKSLRDERYDLMLPNSLGLTCESEDRVLEALHGILAGDKSIGHATQLPELAKDVIYNFEHDSFAALTDYVHQVSEKIAPTNSSLDSVLRRHQKYERVRPMTRKLKAKLRPRHQTMMDKFYGLEYIDMQSKFKKVQQILNKDVKFTMLSNRVFTVEC